MDPQDDSDSIIDECKVVIRGCDQTIAFAREVNSGDVDCSICPPLDVEQFRVYRRRALRILANAERDECIPPEWITHMNELREMCEVSESDDPFFN